MSLTTITSEEEERFILGGEPSPNGGVRFAEGPLVTSDSGDHTTISSSVDNTTVMSNNKHGSPSAFSTGSDLSTPQSGSGSSGSSSVAEYSLVFRKEPPAYVFPDEEFEIEVGLEHSTSIVSSGRRGTSITPSSPGSIDAELVATLQPFNSPASHFSEDATLDVGPMPIRISSSDGVEGEGGNMGGFRSDKFKVISKVIKCKIQTSNVSNEKQTSFVIQIAQKKSDGATGSNSNNNNDRLLSSITTSRITIVNYKLQIIKKSSNSTADDDDETDENSDWEPIWYKDEGGRDKCMTVTIGLYNSKNELEKGKRIPLQLKLMYENNTLVSKQNILRTIGSTKHYLDKRSGVAIVRFRIDDVSKNHQGQDFYVSISSDPNAKQSSSSSSSQSTTPSGLMAIAPACTPVVNIRSKRNKRQREQSRKQALAEQSSSKFSRQVPVGTSSSEYSRFGMAGGYGGDHTGSIVDLGSTASSSRQTSLSRRLQEEAGRGGGLGGPGDTLDPQNIIDALKNVIDWTEEVVHSLHNVQWQIIGYGQNPDGSPDYDRPYYNMPNPNTCISRVLSVYSESTRDNLRVLTAAVESGIFPGNRTSAGMGESGGGVSGSPGPYHMGYHPSMYPPAQTRGQMIDHATGGYPSQQLGGGLGLRQSSMFGSSVSPEQGAAQMRIARTPNRVLGEAGGMGEMQAFPPSDTGALPLHLRQQQLQQKAMHGQASAFEEDHGESSVEYVLAKQFKALRTGERLGFPAYNVDKELIGFYRESSMKVGVGQFVPIARHREEFGRKELEQAKQILEDAIQKRSEAVHTLKDWGSLSNLIDHALVYDWSKDISGGTGGTPPVNRQQGGSNN